jgi:hypothetical protein
MEPELDRVRRNLGIALLILLFVGILGGVALLGRIVGDAVGTASVPKAPSAEGMPYPEHATRHKEEETLPGGFMPLPPLPDPNMLPTPPPQKKSRSR